MATLLPLPFALSPHRPVSLAAYSVESRPPLSLPLEPFLPRSFPLLALAAFYLSRTTALHCCAARLRLPCPPPHPRPPRLHVQPVDGVWSLLRGLAATALVLHVRQRLVRRSLLAAHLPLLLHPYRRTDLSGRPWRRLPEQALGLRPLSPRSTPFSPLSCQVSLCLHSPRRPRLKIRTLLCFNLKLKTQVDKQQNTKQMCHTTTQTRQLVSTYDDCRRMRLNNLESP